MVKSLLLIQQPVGLRQLRPHHPLRYRMHQSLPTPRHQNQIMDGSPLPILSRPHLPLLPLRYPRQVHRRWRRPHLPKSILHSSCSQSVRDPSSFPEQLHPLVRQSDRFPPRPLHLVPLILTPKLHLRKCPNVLPLHDLPETLQSAASLRLAPRLHERGVDLLPHAPHRRLLQLPPPRPRLIIYPPNPIQKLASREDTSPLQA